MKSILGLLGICLLLVSLSAAQDCKTAVVFNVDGSSSESDSQFDAIRQFLLNFSDLYNYGDNLIALVQFSSQVKVEQGITGSKSKFDNAVQNMVQEKASTKTGAGINQCQALLDGVSDDYEHIIVTLTDGAAKDDAQTAANDAMAQGTTMFALGLGNEGVTEAGLQQIASTPYSTHVYIFVDFNQIETSAVAQALIDGLCPIVINDPQIQSSKFGQPSTSVPLEPIKFPGLGEYISNYVPYQLNDHNFDYGPQDPDYVLGIPIKIHRSISDASSIMFSFVFLVLGVCLAVFF